MLTLVDAMSIPVHGMSLLVPTEVLHGVHVQGRLDNNPYNSWTRISEARQYVPPPPYTATELEQLRSRTYRSGAFQTIGMLA